MSSFGVLSCCCCCCCCCYCLFAQSAVLWYCSWRIWLYIELVRPCAWESLDDRWKINRRALVTLLIVLSQNLSTGTNDENFRIFVVCFLLGNSPASEFYMSTFRNTVLPSYLSAYENGTECSETSAYIRRRGITQKKAYNIQNTAKVWNKKFRLFVLKPEI